jgi:excisionase family DNA binding protein
MSRQDKEANDRWKLFERRATMTTPRKRGFKTVQETAKILKLGIHPVYRAIKKGEIRAIRVGGAIRVPDAELDRLQRGDAVCELQPPPAGPVETKVSPGVAPDGQAVSALDDLCFQHQVAVFDGFGARVSYEFLRELGEEQTLRLVIEEKIRRYIQRLTPELLCAAGADPFPPPPIHLSGEPER